MQKQYRKTKIKIFKEKCMKRVAFLTVLLVLFLAAGIVYAGKEVPCPRCNGSRKVTENCPNSSCRNGGIPCTACNASGEKKERCTGCNNGYIEKITTLPCQTCKGYKTVTENRPVACGHCRNGQRAVTVNGQVKYVKCDTCNGTGKRDNYVKVTCPTCNGTGNSGTTQTSREKHNCDNGYITKKCDVCQGNRGTTCPTCKGYASIQKDCPKCWGRGTVTVADD
jgi:RecJ-like exonuclease